MDVLSQLKKDNENGYMGNELAVYFIKVMRNHLESKCIPEDMIDDVINSSLLKLITIWPCIDHNKYPHAFIQTCAFNMFSDMMKYKNNQFKKINNYKEQVVLNENN